MKKNKIAVPKCGASDKRNLDYEYNYTPEKFFKSIVKSSYPIIFDVGAHKGESIKFFKKLYKTANIFSFEPDPSNFEELEKVSKLHKTIAQNVAIGMETGITTFFQQSLSHLGGLLPINSNSTDSLGYASQAKNTEVQVECKRLDDLVNSLDIEHIDILKIDVQGYEVGVLKGASEALKKVQVIMIEISLYDFYDNAEGSWYEVNDILRKASFKLFDVAKVSKNPKNLRTDWVELIFIKH